MTNALTSFGSNYVSERALANLKHYRYGAVDKSYVSKYLLQPYWSWAVQFFPLWMAPNLITLIGFGFMIGNLLLALWKIPDLVGPTDSWVYFSFAAGIWLYSTFDNVDGKQARRTGTSSPLGELFDHGCDALNCSIGGVIQVAGMGLGNTWIAVIVPYLAIVAFYFTTWEEYHTGVLQLGVINGPTEGLVMACVVMVLSGVYGPHIWSLPMRAVLPKWAALYMSPLLSWTVTEVMAGGLVAILVLFQIPLSLLTVYKKKKRRFAATLVELAPIVAYSAFGYLWLSAPGSIVLKNHAALFILTMGIVFGRIATKIILSYVTRSEFPVPTIMLAPAGIGALLANAPQWFGVRVFTPGSEYRYLVIYFSFVVVAYTHWALLVIDRFCAHLGIKCLTIPYKKANAQVPAVVTPKKVSPKTARKSATPTVVSARSTDSPSRRSSPRHAKLA